MKISKEWLLAIAIIIALLVVWAISSNRRKYPPPTIEKASRLRAYHFGFPTHGDYHGYGGLKSSYPHGGLKGYPYGLLGEVYDRDYRGYQGRYWPYGYGPYGSVYAYPGRRRHFRRKIKPYLTGSCYSSSKDEDCRRGYSKTRRDSDDDGKPDEWLCCRDADIY